MRGRNDVWSCCYFIDTSFTFLAQKHIDNALDIQDDDVADNSIPDDTKMVKSKTMPSIQENKKEEENSVWGSFNSGSFFETKPSLGPITYPPPRKSLTSSGI